MQHNNTNTANTVALPLVARFCQPASFASPPRTARTPRTGTASSDSASHAMNGHESPWHCVIHEILPRTKQGKTPTLLSRAKLFMPDSAKAQDDHSMNGPESLALCHSRNPPTDQARKDADTAKPGKAVHARFCQGSGRSLHEWS